MARTTTNWRALQLRLAVMALLGARVLPAQEGPGRAPGSLILAELYGEVKRANPTVQAAHASARAAEARIAGARVPPDPQVQLAFMNYSPGNLRPMDPLGMTQLQVMQMVPVAGKLSLTGRVARTQADAARSRAAATEWDQRTKVAEVFYELYAADRQLDIAKETRRLLEDIASIARSMYEVGEGRQADVLRAQVELARMTEDITRMLAMRDALEGRLNALLNRPPGTPVASPLLPRFPAGVPSLDSLQHVAMDLQPMIRAGEQDLEAAASNVDLARREIWPDLQVGVQYGQRAGEMGTERMGSLMIGASLPVFARSRQLRMRDEASAMRAMVAADLDAMRADTRGRMAVAHANLSRARNLSSLYRGTIIAQADATVNSALAAYRVGGVDFMTLLDDRMAVNRYRQELVKLEAEEGMAWAELEMLVGLQLLDPGDPAPDGRDGGTLQ